MSPRLGRRPGTGWTLALIGLLALGPSACGRYGPPVRRAPDAAQEQVDARTAEEEKKQEQTAEPATE